MELRHQLLMSCISIGDSLCDIVSKISPWHQCNEGRSIESNISSCVCWKGLDLIHVISLMPGCPVGSCQDAGHQNRGEYMIINYICNQIFCKCSFLFQHTHTAGQYVYFIWSSTWSSRRSIIPNFSSFQSRKRL